VFRHLGAQEIYEKMLRKIMSKNMICFSICFDHCCFKYYLETERYCCH